MMPWRRLAPLLVGAALAMGGLALGSQLQYENALPADVRSAQVTGDRPATGDVIAVTGLVAALGITIFAGALSADQDGQHSRGGWRRRMGARAAIFVGGYLTVNLLQTMWPYVVRVEVGSSSQAALYLNLFASNTGALPSVLVPIFALAVGGLLLLFWGVRNVHGRPAPADLGWGALLRRQTGTLLLAAPFLALSAWSALRLMVALPPVLGSTPYRGLLSLTGLAFFGLLAASTAKAARLKRATQDRGRAPLDLDAWEGLGRVEMGLVALLLVLVLVGFAIPSFPPSVPDCAKVHCALNDPAIRYGDDLRAIGDMLQSGRTFGTREIHIHMALLLAALVPMAPLAAVHRQVRRATQESSGTRYAVPAMWWPALGSALAACVLFGGLLTWFGPGSLWAWVGALVPCAAAARWTTGPVREVQVTLLAAWAAWGIGNSISARYDAAGLQFQSNMSVLEVWRVLGAVIAAYAVARAVHSFAGRVKPSTAMPLVGGVAVAVLAVLLLECPLDVWGDTLEDLGTAHPPSVYTGTQVASAGVAAGWAIHAVSFAFALAAAVMVARLVRPEWFRRGGSPVAAVQAAPATA